MFKPVAQNPRDCLVSRQCALTVLEVRIAAPGTKVKMYIQRVSKLHEKKYVSDSKRLKNKGKTYFKIC